MPGQTRTGDQASLECSSTLVLLLLKGAMYVFQFMLNKIMAIRVWTQGLPRPMHVFLVIVLFTSFLIRVPNRFEPRLKV